MAQTLDRRTADARHILSIQERLRSSRAGQEMRGGGANCDGVHTNTTANQFGCEGASKRVNRTFVSGIEGTIGDPGEGVDRAIENDRCRLIEKAEGFLDGEIRPFEIGIQHLVKSSFIYLFQ